MVSIRGLFCRFNRSEGIARLGGWNAATKYFSTIARICIKPEPPPPPPPPPQQQQQYRYRHWHRHRQRHDVPEPSGRSYYGRILCNGGVVVVVVVVAIGSYILRRNDTIRVNFSLPIVDAASVATKRGGGLRDQFNFIADIVEECANAVVCVDIKDTRRLDYFSSSHPSMTNGSGFIVEESGLILTNAHVVMGHPRSAVQIRLADGTVYPGVVEDMDVKSDLATIRVKPESRLPVMKLGVSKDLRPGEWVIAMGSPLSLSNTITAGVVSSVSRTSSELGLFDKDMDYIQTDASITFGNSGGPLVNLDGQVVGINAMKVSAGISFAIPIDCARLFLERSATRRSKGITTPSTKRYLGVTMLTLNADTLRALQIRNHYVPADLTRGALVWKVVVGSPAYRGGLVPGDVVTEINGVPVESSNAVYQTLEKHNLLNVRVYRDNAYFDLVIYPEDVS